MAAMGITGRPVFSIGNGNLAWNVWGTYILGTFAKATAIGGLPVPVAAIPLPPPVRPCFPDLESRNLNRLRLISFASRTRAWGKRSPFEPMRWSRRRSGPRAARWNLALLGEGLALADNRKAGLLSRR
jgi:hypothetical protein